MKRFTETTKWQDPWYRKLSCKHKNLWQYLCDNCDNAGVWKKDYELASFQIGEEITEKDLQEINNGKERVTILDDKILVREFIPFQVGEINSEKLTNLQKNCLYLLDKYSKQGIDVTGSLPVAMRYKYKGKGKGKGKGNKRGIYKGERFTPPTIEDVRAYCDVRKRGVNPEKWYNHYKANGWKVGPNKMKDWHAAVHTWETPQKEYTKKRRPAALVAIELKAQRIDDIEIKRILLADGYNEKEADAAINHKI